MAQRKRKPRPPDLGTQEAIAHRIRLVGDGNPQLASYPLGVLLARKLITQDQHNAGLRYAGLSKEILRIGPRQPTIGTEPDDEAAARMMAQWRALCVYLLAAGRDVKAATDQVCVYERAADAGLVRVGLATLQKAFYGRKTQ